MSLLDDVKILTTANASKAGTLYSVKPDSGLADLDITRATTATVTNSTGVIETIAVNVPQLDFTGGGCPSFKLEPQKTNLVKMSDQLDNALYWTPASGLAVTGNTTVSPDGSTNADTIVGDPDGSINQMYFISGVASQFTFSFYAKRGTMTDMKYKIYDMTNAVDIVAPTSYYAETSSATWNRITVTFTNSASTNHVRLYPFIDNTGSTGAGETCFIWGVQLEAASVSYAISYVTSYIPTTTAAVTRNRTSFDKTGLSSLIGQTEGVFFLEMETKNDQSDFGFISMGASSTNQVGFGYTNNGFWLQVLLGGAGINVFYNTLGTPSGYFKIAGKYKSGDFAVWINGSEAVTSSVAGTASGTWEKISSGYGTGTIYPPFVNIKQIQVYDTILTDAQLLALTT